MAALAGPARRRGTDRRAYLTTAVSRICYDLLGSPRSRRERYVGPWLPEPVVADDRAQDPQDRVTLDESAGMALLAVLERATRPAPSDLNSNVASETEISLSSRRMSYVSTMRFSLHDVLVRGFA